MTGIPITPIERVEAALIYLSAARQAQMDETTCGVYMLALNDLEPSLIERACYTLAKAERAPYEPPMPSVGTIRALCRHLLADSNVAQTAKMLTAARAIGPPEVSKGEAKAFVEQLRARVNARLGKSYSGPKSF